MGHGQYKSLGEYCNPHTASSGFLILLLKYSEPSPPPWPRPRSPGPCLRRRRGVCSRTGRHSPPPRRPRSGRSGCPAGLGGRNGGLVKTVLQQIALFPGVLPPGWPGGSVREHRGRLVCGCLGQALVCLLYGLGECHHPDFVLYNFILMKYRFHAKKRHKNKKSVLILITQISDLRSQIKITVHF